VQRPNVLLITLDTTRADRIGAYGYKLARTPRLDKLASEGVRAARAISAAPITAVAHSSILTGLLPPAHGVRDNGAFILPDAIETLPEVLERDGYATAAFVSAAVLDSRYNLSQGFDTYDDDLWSEDAPEMFMIRERRGARTAALAIDWLKAHRAAHPDQPFFLWVHLFDVHEPHEPAPIDALFAASRYDAEITGVDRHVGALLDAIAALPAAEQTLVVVTADHGESLGEHGESTHGIFVYESTLHIPLLLRWPGHLPAGRVYEGPVHQVDLYPTILAATGSKAPANQGADLLDALAGKAQAPARAQYSESKMSELGFGMAPLHALRDGDYTYVRAPRPELYDRSSDPKEEHDLIAQQPEVAARMSAQIDRLIKDSEARGFHAREQPIDQQTEETLRALGYVGDSSTRKEVAAMDPKDGIGIYEALHEARQLVRTAHFKEASAVLKKMLETTPRNVSALNVLALCEQRLGHRDAALQLYLKSLEVEPDQARVHLQLASIMNEQRRTDDALAQAKEAVRLSPSFVEALVMLGVIELRRGNKEQADAYYRQALRADPKFPRALHVYADMYFRQGDYKNALAYYEKTLERAPRNFEAIVQAGVAAQRLGDMQTGLRYAERGAALRPDSWMPPYNAACIYARQGERALALEQLRRAVANSISEPDLMTEDADLASLREDPEFIALANQAQVNWRAVRARPAGDGEPRAAH
jgi:arylsulfatase A-like enzyme/tetratricopeptide (TPR) repeat protein